MAGVTSASKELGGIHFFTETKQSVEFSKSFANTMRRANRQRIDAWNSFWSKDLPRGVAKDLAAQFNKAVKLYNHSREAVRKIVQQQGALATDKTFTIEENFRNAAASFQRVKDLLGRYARTKDAETTHVSSRIKGVDQVRKLKQLGYGLTAAALLAACAPQNVEVAPSIENEETPGEQNSNNNSGEELLEATQEGTEIDPATIEAPNPALAEIQQGVGQIVEDNTFLTTLETTSGIDLDAACIDFAKRGQDAGHFVIGSDELTISIGSDGTCYALIRNADGSETIIRNQWDAKNNPMYLSLAGAQAVAPTVVRITPEGRGYDVADKLVTAVNSLNQWQAVDANGQLPGTAVVVTPTAINEPNPAGEYVGVITPAMHEQTFNNLASNFLAGAIEFPSNLTREQYSTMIDTMNEQRGPKPIYVEVVDNNGNPTVMYYDTQKREMATLTGTYESNKEIIDQHAFDIYVKIGENEQGLTTYTHPDTGEEVVVANSSGVDWDWVGNKNNAQEQIDPETLKNVTIDAIFNKIANRADSILPVILINQEEADLVAFQGQTFNYNCLEVVMIKDGVGIRMFVGREASWKVINEGSSDEERVMALENASERNMLPVNMVYYIFFENDQAKNWERSIQEFDTVENTYDADEVYKAVTEGYSTEENIVLRVPVIIKKK